MQKQGPHLRADFLCLKVILSKGRWLDRTTSLVSSFVQLVLITTQDFLCHSIWFSKYSKKWTLLDISFMNSVHFAKISFFWSIYIYIRAIFFYQEFFQKHWVWVEESPRIFLNCIRWGKENHLISQVIITPSRSFDLIISCNFQFIAAMHTNSYSRLLKKFISIWLFKISDFTKGLKFGNRF